MHAKTPPAAVAGPLLRPLVFMTGAAILVIEITGSKVLAPHFGNTLFAWTGLIGVVLAALSLGYVLGGWLADRRPSLAGLLGLIGVSALLVALIAPASSLLRPVALAAGYRFGPLLASLVLFAPPAVTLAAASPWAVRLAGRELERLGRVAGSLYAWSTLGSIAGVFVSGFVLLPRFGTRGILLGTSLALALAALGAWLVASRPGGWLTALPASAALLLAGWLAAPRAEPAGNVLFEGENFYHAMEVVRERDEQRQVLSLYLDRSHAGVFDEKTGEGLGDFVAAVAVADGLLARLETALVLGGGIGAIPRRIESLYPHARVTLVELDPFLFELAERYFRLGELRRLETVADDARLYLDRSSRRYDLIYGDVYFGFLSIPAHVMTREFFELVRLRLEPGGLFLMNVIGARAGPDAELYQAILRTLATVFPEVYVVHARSAPAGALQSLVLVAPREPRSLDPALMTSADLGRLDRSLKLVRPDPVAYASAPLLTDDHAPVELLAARMAARLSPSAR